MSCVVRTEKIFWWTQPVSWEVNGIEPIRFALVGHVWARLSTPESTLAMKGLARRVWRTVPTVVPPKTILVSYQHPFSSLASHSQSLFSLSLTAPKAERSEGSISLHSTTASLPKWLLITILHARVLRCTANLLTPKLKVSHSPPKMPTVLGHGD